jgi:hypothetical protein
VVEKGWGGLASGNGRRESGIGPDPAGVRGVRAAAWQHRAADAMEGKRRH